MVLDLDPHIFEQTRIPQSPVAIDNRFTVERILRLEPKVIGDRVHGERHATFNHDIADGELLLGDSHRRDHYDQGSDGNSSRRHRASSPWTTAVTSLVATTGRSSSTHILRSAPSASRC